MMAKAERLSRNVIYENPWINLYRDKVKFPTGLVVEEYHILDFPRPAVAVAAENDRGSIVLASICRYPTGVTSWELPAGRVEDGENDIDAARRELLEETGYASEDHRLIYGYYPAGGTANLRFNVVRCRATQFVQDFDRGEVSETRWFTRSEVEQLINYQAVVDGLSLTGLLLWLRAA